jgi:hypothetical protein
VVGGQPPVIQFDQQHAVWDANDPNYLGEFEFGKSGHYDYTFVNTSAGPAEMGLEFMSCGCSKVKVCVLNSGELDAFKKDHNDAPLHWQDLPRSEVHGVTVPPGSGGIVRLGFEVRKVANRTTLTIRLWSNAQGKARSPEIELNTAAAFVMPVRYSPAIKDIGYLGPRGSAHAEFWFWSATRDRFDLDVREKREDPCFVFRATDLTPEQCRQLEKRLNTERGFSTRVKRAYKVEVEVYEQRGGKQLDLGPFQRNVPMVVDNAPPPEGENGPLLKGWVRNNDIVIGNPEDLGHIDLKTFPLDGGRERRVPLSTDATVTLALDQVPSFLDAELTLKEKANGKARWELRVKVKPRMLRPGMLPDDSAILLRLEGPSARRIRIPVLGNAVQG